MEVKYIFITGGVVSGLGKGITAASLGLMLKSRGVNVAIQKFDPYINVDPGTMNPYQHGEVFVTEDGTETDLDLGHYERFIDESLNKYSSITTGKIYSSVIEKERRGEFLGATVQVIPHITNEIKDKIYRLGEMNKTDIVITEVGGTVGDIESLPFLEAIRQVKSDVGNENVMYIHVTLIPSLNSGELKTKPTQHSVKELRSIGIQPDIIVCRTEKQMDPKLKEKIGLFCDIPTRNVIENINVDSIYEVPLVFESQDVGELVCKELGLGCMSPNLKDWKDMILKSKQLNKKINISLVGKYVDQHDAYISVIEALKASGIENNANIEINLVNSEELTQNNFNDMLKNSNGILVPGGFGDRGIDGKILATRFARENNIPFLGICLGMQIAVIEFARNVCGLKDADSFEFDRNTPNPVIHIMEEQTNIKDKGGTMRLGVYPCKIHRETKAMEAYNNDIAYERHRHRYEFNNEYRKSFSDKGLIASGTSPDGLLVEMIEILEHKWFVGVQFHPEFTSRPNRAHPLFRDFIKAAL